MISKGSKVVCVTNSVGHFNGGKSIRLTIGKVYEINDTWQPNLGPVGEKTIYYFVNDDVSSDYYPSELFKALDVIRSEKLTQIGL